MQLRNLVWATSKHDVYLMSHYSVLHWSALSGVDTELMNVQGHVAPREVRYTIVVYHLSQFFTSSTVYLLVVVLLLMFMDLLQKHPGSLLEGFSQTQVSTLAVKDNLLVAGGFQGELICKVGCPNRLKCIFICYLFWHGD